MRPTVLKVLKQEPVSQSEWQELFYGVHLICLWDEKGAIKIYDCLQEDIVAFIDVISSISHLFCSYVEHALAIGVMTFHCCCSFFQQAQVRVLAQREEQALLKAYIIEWRKFFTQSNYLPLPFRQLETIHVQVCSINRFILTMNQFINFYFFDRNVCRIKLRRAVKIIPVAMQPVIAIVQVERAAVHRQKQKRPTIVSCGN